MSSKIILILLTAVWAGVFSLHAGERALIAKGRELERAKKYAEAVAFYAQAVQEKKLSPNTCRLFLNRCGYLENDTQKKIDYYRRSCLVPGSDATENYRTYLWLGGCYRKFNPGKALGYYQNMPDPKAIHPSLIYQGYMEIGKVYELQGKKTLAVEAYTKALAAGKSITYKYNYSAAEKALARLNNKEK